MEAASNCSCMLCSGGIWVCGCPPDCDSIEFAAPPWTLVGTHPGITGPFVIYVRVWKGGYQVKLVPTS